jgi:hypothetical protein
VELQPGIPQGKSSEYFLIKNSLLRDLRAFVVNGFFSCLVAAQPRWVVAVDDNHASRYYCPVIKRKQAPKTLKS